MTSPPSPERPVPDETTLRRGRVPSTGVPSLLDLVRLSPQPVFPPGGEGLYRQIARLTELTPASDVLDVACGRGITTAFLASSYGLHGTGVDFDASLIAEAEQRARSMELDGRLTFECAPLDDLPFQDDVFDVAIGEVALGAYFDPAAAVRELARVTRPYGTVVLVQLIWTGNVEPEAREALVQHLGARPLLLVEWKQMLRDAGCVDLHVEDWSDYSGPFRPEPVGPFHDLSRLFTLRQRVSILLRAARRWGWRGVRGALEREQEIQTMMSRNRVLGLSLIRATKWPGDETAEGRPQRTVE